MVEHDEVVHPGGELGDAGGGVFGLFNVVVLFLETLSQGPADELFVFDDEDARSSHQFPFGEYWYVMLANPVPRAVWAILGRLGCWGFRRGADFSAIRVVWASGPHARSRGPCHATPHERSPVGSRLNIGDQREYDGRYNGLNVRQSP